LRSSSSTRERGSRILSIDETLVSITSTVLNTEVLGGLVTSDPELIDLESRPSGAFSLRPTSSNYSTRCMSMQDSVKDDLSTSLDYSKEVLGETMHPYLAQGRVSDHHRFANGAPRPDSITNPWELTRKIENSPPRHNVHVADSEATTAGSNDSQAERSQKLTRKFSLKDEGFGVAHREPPSFAVGHVTINSDETSQSAHKVKPGPIAVPNRSYSLPLLEAAKVIPWELDEPGKREDVQITRYTLKSKSEALSTELVPTSRPISSPWNLDESYRWSTHEGENISNTLFNPDTSSPKTNTVHENSSPASKKDNIPKFKLQITRASNSSNGTVRVSKTGQSTQAMQPGLLSPIDQANTVPSDVTLSSDIFIEPRVEIQPGQSRIIEHIDGPSTENMLAKPLPALPSEEVESFFSDESSQRKHKGVLGKRLSSLFSITNKASSFEDLRKSRTAGNAWKRRKARGSNLALSCVSSPGQSLDGASMFQTKKESIAARIKRWWRKSERKIKQGFRSPKKNKNVSRSTELYDGV
jgi:hypothetical protein